MSTTYKKKWIDKYHMRNVVVLTFFLLLLVGCDVIELSYPIMHSFPNDLDIPNADIIYQTDRDDRNSLGTYNISTKTEKIITTDYSLQMPQLIDNGTFIALSKGNPRWDVHTYFGELYIIQKDNKEDICRNSELGGFQIHHQSDNILLEDGDSIKLINSRNCLEISTVFSINELPEKYSKFRIGSFSSSFDGRYKVISIVSTVYKMILVDTLEKTTYEYPFVGMNPSISPNMEQVSFINNLGLMVMNLDGKENQLLVYITPDDFITPDPKWSPDGKKLLYQRCSKQGSECSGTVDDYGIYIYNFETSNEELLANNGINPSWYP
jgi:hypothetical protein